MSGKLIVLFTAASLATIPQIGKSAASSFYCTQNSSYINLGDTPEQVEQACGKPDSTQVINGQSSQTQQVQQWIYYKGSQSMVVNVVNNQVQSLNVAGQNTQNSSFCQSAQQLAVGNSVSQLRAACSSPVLVRNVNMNVAGPTTQQMQWTYNQGYSGTLTLTFENFKLVSIQQ